MTLGIFPVNLSLFALHLVFIKPVFWAQLMYESE